MRVPKYRHQKSTGRALVEINGKRIYLGKHGTKESRARYAAIIRDLEKHREKASAPPTPPQRAPQVIKELVLAYWQHVVTSRYVKKGKPTPQRFLIRSALRWLLDSYGEQPAGQFNVGMLEAVRDRMAESGKLCRRTVNRYVKLIPPMFKWAVKQKWIPASVWHELLTVDLLAPGRLADPQDVPPVPDEIVATTLPYLPAVVQAMVRYQRLTGCRPGEVCIVRPCDVERPTAARGGTLPTPDVARTWWYRPHDHKTEHHDQERRISIGPRAQEILRPYLDRPAEAYCFSPRGDTFAPLQPHSGQQLELFGPAELQADRRRGGRKHQGPRYTNNSYRRAITRACELAFGMPEELRTMRARPPRRLLAQWARQPEEKQAELLAAWNQQRAELRKQAAAWRQEYCWAPNQLRHTLADAVEAEFDLVGVQVVLGHKHAKTSQLYVKRSAAHAASIMAKIG